VRPLQKEVDAMNHLSRLFTREYELLWIGAVFILLSGGSVYFGVCPGRGSRAYRSKEPKAFWFGVIIYFLAGVFFWIRFFYQSN
jgi:hypothetical protein